MLYLIIVAVLFFALGYYLAKYNKEDEVTFNYPTDSELSKPTVNIPPTFFERPHYQVLQVLYENDPFYMHPSEINAKRWKKSYDTYARKLWLEWMVDRKKYEWSDRLYYAINSKGKKTLLQFNNKF